MSAPRPSKVRRDLIWNYGSLALMAGSGVLINAIIAFGPGEAALGIFNQAFAVYIVASQFAVLGVHFSVLRHISAEDDTQEHRTIFTAGLLLALVIGTTIGALVYMLASVIATALDSQTLQASIMLIGIAVPMFAINKVLLMTLNGLHYMRAFAIAQGLRPLALILSVASLVAMQRPTSELTGAFILSEALVLLGVLPWLIRNLGLRLQGLGHWVQCHFVFGVKAVMHGILVELNTRVDVLMLGYFASDALVGRYSFAAMLAEGFYQLLVVIRNYLNPLLARSLKQEGPAGVEKLIVANRRKIVLAMAGIGVILIGGYFLVGKLALLPEGLPEALPVLAILVLAITLCSGLIPFEWLLSQSGAPGRQTQYSIMVVGTNISLNALLIPWAGMVGAAAATGASYLASMLYLRALVARHTGVNLFVRHAADTPQSTSPHHNGET